MEEKENLYLHFKSMFMKRLLLFLFVFAYFSQVKASDTLTIRQVYNFDVGDTFDYYHFTATGRYYTYPCNDTLSKGYQRNIILSRKDAIDSITYIISNSFNTYPPSSPLMSMDTVIITHLDSSLLDTAILFYNFNYHSFPFFNIGNWRQMLQFQMYQGMINWDTIGNKVYSHFDPEHYIYRPKSESWYYNKLGMTYYYGYTLDGDGMPGNVLYQLVCYSKGNKHACGPNYLAGINDIEKGVNVKVYPNPASDQLHLSVTNAGQLNARFIITDILGQELFSIPVIQDESTLDISKFSQGIYTWKLFSDNSVLKTGKVIKD
jgi:hypothetical protein